ncbi:queuosine precursor transporter [Candidatus Gracilibacteria bacterium]|nr:queuosine precursor transporter [Candidatus Gracilibacteria bacterium]
MQNKNYKYLTLITVIFITILLVSNIVSSKIVNIRKFTFDAGTILFPLSYIFGDILTEVYGYKQSRKIIRMGFGSALLMSLIIIIVGLLPAAADRPYQESYQNILGLTPRIVIASLIAYFAGEFSNSYLLAKIKIRMKGKKLRIRTIGSTIIAQIFDTGLFVFIAFAGIFEPSLLWIILVSNYIFKVGIEILFTPLTYLITNKLKKSESEDYYDKKTNFNPFKLH